MDQRTIKAMAQATLGFRQCGAAIAAAVGEFQKSIEQANAALMAFGRAYNEALERSVAKLPEKEQARYRELRALHVYPYDALWIINRERRRRRPMRGLELLPVPVLAA